MDEDFIGATQALPLSDYDDEVDDNNAKQDSQTKKLCATLRVLTQKDYPETDMPIYEGTNVIGRGEGSNIHIPLKALSKEHACIEVIAGAHIIYDKGSLNKSRRRKLLLTPEVRYELQDGDHLIFGNVQCIYMFAPPPQPEGDETGSETGSESMIPQDLEEAQAGLGQVASDQVDDVQSDTSSGVIEPSQNINNNKVASSMMLVPDSGSEPDMSSTGQYEAGDTMLALVLDESDLTLGADAKNTSVGPTMVYQMDQELGDGDQMETQAYVLEPEEGLTEKSDVQESESKETEIPEVGETVADDMDIDGGAHDKNTTANSDMTQSFVENDDEDIKEMAPVLDLGASTLVVDDDFIDDIDNELSDCKMGVQQETASFEAGCDTMAAQDYDIPTQVLLEAVDEAHAPEDGATLVLNTAETVVQEEREVNEPQADKESEFVVEETQVLNDAETQVLAVGDTQVPDGVSDSETTEKINIAFTEAVSREANHAPDQATQVLVDTPQVSGDGEAATDLIDSTAHTPNARQVAETTPSPKKKVMWALDETQVFSDEDVTDEGSKSTSTQAGQGSSAASSFLKPSGEARDLEDDCNTTQLLDDSCVCLEVDESPINLLGTTKHSASTAKPASNASSLEATQLLVCDENTETESGDDTEGTTSLLGNTCPSLIVDESPYSKPARQAAGAFDTLVATQVFDDTLDISESPRVNVKETPAQMHTKKASRPSDAPREPQVDSDATQIRDDGGGDVNGDDSDDSARFEVEETPVCQMSKQANLASGMVPSSQLFTAGVTTNSEPQSCADTKSERPVPRIETFIHPDEVATQAYGMVSDSDADESGDESEDIDFGSPVLNKQTTRTEHVGGMLMLAEPTACVGDTTETQAYCMGDTAELSEHMDRHVGDEQATQAYVFGVDELTDDIPTETSTNQKAKAEELDQTTPGVSDDSMILLEEIASPGQCRQACSKEKQKCDAPEEAVLFDQAVMMSPPAKGKRGRPRKTVKVTQGESSKASEDNVEPTPLLPTQKMGRSPRKSASIYGNIEQRRIASSLSDASTSGSDRKRKQVTKVTPAKRRLVTPTETEQVILTSQEVAESDVAAEVSGGIGQNESENLEMDKSDSAGNNTQTEEANEENVSENIDEEPMVKKDNSPQRKSRQCNKPQSSNSAPIFSKKGKKKAKDEPLIESDSERSVDDPPLETLQTDSEKAIQDEDVDSIRGTASPAPTVKKEVNRADTPDKHSPKAKTLSQAESEGEKDNAKVQNPKEQTPIKTHGRQTSHIESDSEEPMVLLSGGSSKTVIGKGKSLDALAEVAGEKVSVLSATDVHTVDGVHISHSKRTDTDVDGRRAKKPRGSFYKSLVGEANSQSSVVSTRATCAQGGIEAVNEVAVKSTSKGAPIVTRTTRNHAPKEAQLLTMDIIPLPAKLTTSSEVTGVKVWHCEKTVPILETVEHKQNSQRGPQSEEQDDQASTSLEHEDHIGVISKEIGGNSAIKEQKGRGRSVIKSDTTLETGSECVTTKTQRGRRRKTLPVKLKSKVERASKVNTSLVTVDDSASKPNRGSRRKALSVESEAETASDTTLIASDDATNKPKHSSRVKALSVKLETETASEITLIASKDVTNKPRRGGRGKALPVKLEAETVSEITLIASVHATNKPRRGGRGKALSVKLDLESEVETASDITLIASNDATNKPRRGRRGKSSSVKFEAEAEMASATTLIGSDDATNKPPRGGRGKASSVKLELESEAETASEITLIASNDVTNKPRHGGRGKTLSAKLESEAKMASATTLIGSDDATNKPRRGGRRKASSVKLESEAETETASEITLIASNDVTNKVRRCGRGKASPVKLEVETASEITLIASKDITNKPRRGARGKASSVKLELELEAETASEITFKASKDVTNKPRRGGRGKASCIKLELESEAETASEITLIASKDVTKKLKRGGRGKASPVKLEAEAETALEITLIASDNARNKPRRGGRGKASPVELEVIKETTSVSSDFIVNKPRRDVRGKHSLVKSEPVKEATSGTETTSISSEGIKKSRRATRGMSLPMTKTVSAAALAVSDTDCGVSNHGRGRTSTTLQKYKGYAVIKTEVRGTKNMMVKSEDEDQRTGVMQSPQNRSTKRRGSPDSQASNVPGQRAVKRGRGLVEPEGVAPPSGSQPHLRRSFPTSLGHDAQKPRVMFTGVVDDKGQKARVAIIKELGGELADNIFECSHLVTDKVRRTVKLLCGLARGLPIVNMTWLDASRKAHCFVDTSSHLLRDADAEKTHGFKLTSSMQKAARKPMLLGYSVYVTKSVKPDPTQMKEIIKSAGGEFLTRVPSVAADRTLVVSCVDDKGLLKGALAAGVTILSAEFLLTGILRQEVDLHVHRLFPPAPTSVKSRRK